jgi:hypothetical protein
LHDGAQGEGGDDRARVRERVQYKARVRESVSMMGVKTASMRECMTSYCTEVSIMMGSKWYWVRRMCRSMMWAMMSSMREGMSTEVWEMVGSMGYMMDYREVWGKMCRVEKLRMRELCSNMESGVRELMKFEMRELYSNMMYEVADLGEVSSLQVW